MRHAYKMLVGAAAVTSEHSGRAAVFREELQPVKIQCEESASNIVNCSEL
jgi:hypothetical protein